MVMLVMWCLQDQTREMEAKLQEQKLKASSRLKPSAATKVVGEVALAARAAAMTPLHVGSCNQARCPTASRNAAVS